MATCAECGNPLPKATMGRPSMTCSPACGLRRKNRQSAQSRQRAAARGCPPDKHGTTTGYNHYLCRCTKCTTWARRDKARRRREQKVHN